MNRSEARELLEEWTKSESLLRHALSVSLVMEAYALEYDEDPEEWAVTGLLHDADYESYPDQHPQIIVNRLKGLNEHKISYAISAHYTKWGVPYTNRLDKALLACDELTGFIVACSQVRPQGLDGMKAKSVLKKLKQKSFAAKVERNEIHQGITLLGVDLTEHINFIISVLQKHKIELSL